MADYHPLIRRAVDGLSENKPDLRQAVYERARAALLHQLRSLDPPLSEADITREQFLFRVDPRISYVSQSFAAVAPEFWHGKR